PPDLEHLVPRRLQAEADLDDDDVHLVDLGRRREVGVDLDDDRGRLAAAARQRRGAGHCERQPVRRQARGPPAPWRGPGHGGKGTHLCTPDPQGPLFSLLLTSSTTPTAAAATTPTAVQNHHRRSTPARPPSWSSGGSSTGIKVRSARGSGARSTGTAVTAGPPAPSRASCCRSSSM